MSEFDFYDDIDAKLPAFHVEDVPLASSSASHDVCAAPLGAIPRAEAAAGHSGRIVRQGLGPVFHFFFPPNVPKKIAFGRWLIQKKKFFVNK